MMANDGVMMVRGVGGDKAVHCREGHNDEGGKSCRARH